MLADPMWKIRNKETDWKCVITSTFFLKKCIFIYLLFTFFFKFATMKLCSEYETQSKTSKNYFQNGRIHFRWSYTNMT